MSSLPESFKKADEEYIDAIIKSLEDNHPVYAHEIKRRIQVCSEYLGVWYELMVYDWLWKQEKKSFSSTNCSRGK